MGVIQSINAVIQTSYELASQEFQEFQIQVYVKCNSKYINNVYILRLLYEYRRCNTKIYIIHLKLITLNPIHDKE